MKLSFKNILLLLCALQAILVQSSKLKMKLTGKSQDVDPFKALGIPDFKIGIQQPTQSKVVRPKLDSIEDLPRFIESGAMNSGIGMKLLTKFLTEDDDLLKKNGGLFDETGVDGLDQDEDLYPQGSEMRERQRARSAAMLYQRSQEKDTKLEAYGCTPDKEQVDGWLAYNVLLMNPMGDHKLLKVCIQKIDGLISFVGDTNQLICKNKIHIVDSYKQKGKAYFSKKIFAGLKNPFDDIDQKMTGSAMKKIEEKIKETNQSEDQQKKNPEIKQESNQDQNAETKQNKQQESEEVALKKQIEELNKKLQTVKEKSSTQMRFSEQEEKKNSKNQNKKKSIASDIASMLRS